MLKQIFIIVLAFFCVLGLWWAYGQYNQKIEAQGEQSWVSYQKKIEQEAEYKEQLLEHATKAKDQTLADRARYLTLKTGKAKMLLMSSSVPVEEEKKNGYSAWANLLEDSFNGLEQVEIQVMEVSRCGAEKTEMVGEENLEEAISIRPDVLFFELCLPSEGEARDSVETFQEQVGWAMNELEKGLPDTLIIIQTSNPFVNYEIIRPAAGSSYSEFNAEIKEFMEESGWNFIDVYRLMEEKMAEKDLSYRELLAESAVPDAPSYKIWTEVVVENLHMDIVDP